MPLDTFEAASLGPGNGCFGVCQVVASVGPPAIPQSPRRPSVTAPYRNRRFTIHRRIANRDRALRTHTLFPGHVLLTDPWRRFRCAACQRLGSAHWSGAPSAHGRHARSPRLTQAVLPGSGAVPPLRGLDGGR